MKWHWGRARRARHLAHAILLGSGRISPAVPAGGVSFGAQMSVPRLAQACRDLTGTVPTPTYPRGDLARARISAILAAGDQTRTTKQAASRGESSSTPTGL